MREIINTHQVKILTALAGNPGLTRSALIPLSDVYQSRFNLELTDLRERGLASHHDTKRHVNVTVFDITEAGAKALAYHAAHQTASAPMRVAKLMSSTCQSQPQSHPTQPSCGKPSRDAATHLAGPPNKPSPASQRCSGPFNQGN